MQSDKLAKKAADAVGVTPYCDMRPFVEHAVKWALNEAALSTHNADPVKTPLENDAVWARFYRDGKTLGEICEEFKCGIYDLSPWLTAPLTRSALSAQVQDVAETLETYYRRQIEWSRETFGPALRTKGIIDHISKELREIEADPHDLSEWVDVVILAMDGFWRHGGNAEDLFKALIAKQKKNMARTWPDWRTMSEDSAIEHDRSKDAASPASKHGDAE